MNAGVESSSAAARAAVASNPFWYHTLEVAPGVVTPGWFDLRSTVRRLPWPDVRGKRCLDVGTADGFFAFELERRGAGEVVASDLSDHEQWDWPPHVRADGVEYLKAMAGPEKGIGLRIAKDLLGSSVAPREISAYDLSPDTVGRFDVVVCGSLLLHLRDPLRALAAVRSVCRGHLLCTNQVDPAISLMRRPLARLDGVSDLCQWWLPNPAAHRQMVRASGFTIERESGRYAVPFGEAHFDTKWSARRLARFAMFRGDGVGHHAILARPAS